MTKTLRSVLLVLLALLPAVLSAQSGGSGLDLGFFEHRDVVSGTTGLAKLFGRHPEVRSEPFRLDDRLRTRLEGWDMVVIGSFSELHQDWDDFVRREKPDLLNWVARGGTLVRLCRYWKSDRLDILPPGFTVERGEETRDEWFQAPTALSLWDDFVRGKPSRPLEQSTPSNPAWFRRPGGVYGSYKGETLRGPYGAFDKWSSQFTRSANDKDHTGSRLAFALHADHGKGRIILLQLILDKVDGGRDLLEKNLSEDFVTSLVAYGARNPNPAKRRVVRPVTPEPIDPKPIRPEPEDPKPLPPIIRITGRAYLDEDGDGRYDRGELPLEIGVHLDDVVTRTDASGRFTLEHRRDRSAFLRIDLDARFDRTGGWFEFLPANLSDKSVHAVDLALRQTREDVRRAIAASLPAGLGDPAVQAEAESRLIRLARKERARRVVLFAGAATDDDLAAFADRLRRLFAGNAGFQLYFVFNPGSRASEGLAPPDWAFDLGRWRFRCGSAARDLDPLEGLTTVVATAGLASVAGPDLVALGPPGRSGAGADDLRAPLLVDPADLAIEARYLVFEDSDGGALTRLEPEASQAVEEGPSRPIHRFGRGDIGALLDAAVEATKD